MIDVARDVEGLKTAFLELMEEASQEPMRLRAMRNAQHASNSARLVESLSPMHSLSEGYYGRADYLFWLRRSLDAAPGLLAARLRADEMAGLLALEEARQEFQRTHSSCPACGALNKRGAPRCATCGESFKEQKPR